MPPQFVVAQASSRLERIAINGYPDGSFKPEAQVTYAEALAMILRALGYEPTLKGAWPTKYLVKAAELGITKGVTVAANAPAPRGDVAAMVDNALTVDKVVQKGYGDQITYEVVAGETLLKDLGLTKVADAVVVDAGVLLNSDLAPDEVQLQVGAGTPKVYTLKDTSVDPRSLVGLTIDAWVDEDNGELVVIADSNAGDVKTGMVPRVTVSGTSGTVDIGKYDSYDTYNLTSSTVVFLNHQKSDIATLAMWVDNSTASYNDDYIQARFILDGKNVKMIDVVDWGARPQGARPAIVDSVNTRYQKINTKIGPSVSYSGATVSVTRDGKAAKVEDLKAGDVLYAWKNNAGDKWYLAAFSQKVSGVLNSAATNWGTVYVGDTKYSALPSGGGATGGVYLSDDKGDSFETFSDAAADDYLGIDVTAYLGFNNYVVAIAGQPGAEAAENYALVYDVKTGGTFGDTVYIRVFTKTGSKVDLEVTPDTKFDGSTISGYSGMTGPSRLTAVTGKVEVTGKNLIDRTYDLWLVKYALNSEGKLSSVDTVQLTKGGSSPEGFTFDDTNDRITYSTGRVLVKSGTLIFDAKAYASTGASLSVLSWGDIKSKSGTIQGALYTEGSEAKVVVLTSYTFSLAKTGMVLDKQYVPGGLKLVLDMAGETKTYEFDTAEVTGTGRAGSNWGGVQPGFGKITRGNLVQLTFDGSDLSAVTEIPAYGFSRDAGLWDGVVTVTGVKAADYRLTVSGDFNGDGTVESTTLFGDSDTVVYDLTGSSPVKSDFSSIGVGDLVQLVVDPDNVIDYVKVVKYNDLDEIMGDSGGDMVAPAIDASKITAAFNPSGTADTVAGTAGAVEGGATVIAFTDANSNGLYDTGEEVVAGVPAAADGSFNITLGDTNLTTVKVVARDAAGNYSTVVTKP